MVCISFSNVIDRFYESNRRGRIVLLQRVKALPYWPRSTNQVERKLKTRRIGQLALVVSDLTQSMSFYEKVFGLDAIFGTSAFRRELPSRVQGIQDAASCAHWLIDDRQLFQLEIFCFDYPRSRPLQTNHSLTDIGDNRLIVAVRSLQDTLRRVATWILPAHCPRIFLSEQLNAWT